MLGIGQNQRRKLLQRPLIHTALKIDHILDRLPVFHPAPVIEFRLIKLIQAEIALFTAHPQQKPALFLANAHWLSVFPHKTLGQAIPEPFIGTTEDFHMVWFQSHFFVQLPIHGLLGSLILIDTTLGKLPGILPHTPPPEQTILIVAQDNAYIWPETIPINHGNSLYFYLFGLTPFFHRRVVFCKLPSSMAGGRESNVYPELFITQPKT